MSYAEYQKAQKMGEKSYKTCIAKGEYPYLPVLEDMLSQEKSKSQVKLGLVEIPIELIAGTYTSGRTTVFSNDFMPLLDIDTEFAAKWSVLYDSLVEEGQRTPILVYEYFNRFYVVEGNKRVSVMKYMGSVSIEANVIRIMPQRTDSKTNRIYFEFLDFYTKTRVNYILMSKEGSYEKLYKLIHSDESTPFSDDEALQLKSVYSLFSKIYFNAGGKKLNGTVGDVLLTYIEIFGYADIKEKTSDEIKKDIDKIWAEFRMLSDEKPFSMITDPTDESQKVSITKLLSVGGHTMKAAFVYYKEPSVSGWSYCHNLGREYVQSVFGEKLHTEVFTTCDSSDIGLLERIIDDGYKIIFTTTPVLSTISLKCAVLHPDVIILNCSLNTAFRHLRTYYLRIYEAKFIIGAVAGSMTENDRIGYIADYPIFGMPASLNAFALGVKLVNPRAKVYLDWSTLKNRDPSEHFSFGGADIISNRDMTAPIKESREFGLYRLCGDARFNIAMPVWNWGMMYESLIRSVINGSWKNDENLNGIHALNYYWGMSSDAIDVIYSQKIPTGTKKLISILKEQIKSGIYNPFSGEIYDQENNLKNPEDYSMTPEEIINIDWFCDNVMGSIPDMAELDESCHELISQLGVKREQKV